MAYIQSYKTQYGFKGSVWGKLLGTLFSGRLLEKFEYLHCQICIRMWIHKVRSFRRRADEMSVGT